MNPSCNGHCPDGHPHYWLIDYLDVGICKYCLEVRDFGALLRQYQRRYIGVDIGKSRRGGLLSGVTRSQKRNKEKGAAISLHNGYYKPLGT